MNLENLILDSPRIYDKPVCVNSRVGSWLKAGILIVVAGAVVMAVSALFESSQLRMCMFVGGGTTIFLSIFPFLRAASIASERRLLRRTIQKWEQGDYLARWSYTDEWRAFRLHDVRQAQEYEQASRRHTGPLIGGVFLLAVGIAVAIYFYQRDWAVAVTVPTAMAALVVPFLIWSRHDDTKVLPAALHVMEAEQETSGPEVIIDHVGFAVGNQLRLWSRMNQYLKAVRLIDTPGRGIEFEMVTRAEGLIRQKLSVPIPRGKTREAQDVVTRLRESGSRWRKPTPKD